MILGSTLTSADKAFSPDNSLFSSTDERLRARDIAHRVGQLLEKRHPLGWEDSEGLVVFPDNVPNNTVPILYKSKEGSVYKGKPCPKYSAPSPSSYSEFDLGPSPSVGSDSQSEPLKVRA